ncbi:hypothetical protein [Trichlorobacter ammonificans]|uniref:Uncharacterized protein n=1 Tax=Trichlorobacter ammonificans TaxID=2916410 RepID=A0ABM9D3Y9_9BACT|nr:hypothetical protein [Trichlorobacter ammonificans]CAH2029972.1 conserved protein of unknown function [Trichlorobacter ammonificans]
MQLEDVPSDMEVISPLVEKTLSNGMLIEVFLVKRPRQYEAALFIGGIHKPGPPLPRPFDTPTPQLYAWMGVRPKVGFSQEEYDEIIGAVNVQNKLHHCHFMDKWGLNIDED